LAQEILDFREILRRQAALAHHAVSFMPDQLARDVVFARDQSMSEVIRDWKRFHARTNHVVGRKVTSIIDCALTSMAPSWKQR